MRNIIVAFPKIDNGKKIRGILVRNGFQVTAVCTNGAQILATARDLDYAVVLMAYKLPDMIYRDVIADLTPGILPIVVSTRESWQENGDPSVLSLTLPLKVHDLVSTIEMAAGTVDRIRRKDRKKPKKRTAAENAMIARAKELLMERNHMTEEEAHRYLQKTSMDEGYSFTETAQMILSMLDSYRT